MTATEGAAKRLTLLVALITTLLAAPAAHAATVKPSKPTGVPASIAQGGSFTVTVPVKKATKRTKVALTLSKDAKADKKDVKLATLKAVKKKFTAKLTINAAPGAYQLLACVGKACAAKPLKVTAKATPQPAPSAPTAPAPISRPAPGNENLPPGPTPTPDPDSKPGDPTPTPTPPPPIPQDPKDVAPELDPGAATSVYDATKFLYSGAAPIQRNVEPGAISEKTVAVLRGTVKDRDGKPIEGVTVTIVDHHDLGFTRTRADGQFDMVVNGGGVTVQFENAGFLPVQRTLSPNWQDYETLDDVVMVPVDPNAKVIDPNSTQPFQVVQGTESEDKDGERQATLLVPKGTDATMELPNGQTRAVDELKIRVTEFTYGEQGDEAMPGSLPANSGYTYAAEFSVDEALKAGATEVSFDQPLINYTENFIGAPVGSPVPTGYYDRETAEWKAAKNGRVIEVLADGVDTDGDGKADNGLGITDDERRRLASLYEPGQELWRVLITHFTPWDHNWPYGPPPGAKPPKLKEFEWKDPNDPCQQQGSAIGCETQTLSESIPLTGTGMTLDYSTERTPGWRVDETLQIPITGATIPPRLKGISLTIDVAGKTIEKRWCDPNYPTTGASTCKDYPLITPNLDFAFRWDGLDAYDRQIQGRVTAKINVIYVYEFNYYDAPEDFESSFGQFGSDTQVFDGRFACGNRSGNMDTHFFCGIPIGQTITRAIGSWDARPTDGLGGWSLRDHHAYDPVERALRRGDGSTVRSEAMAPVVETLAGTTNSGVGGGRGSSNYPKDGAPADESNIDYLADYVRSPDGNLYLHNGLNRNDIFRISRDGKIYLFAGNGVKGGQPTGDGGPAKAAGLGTVQQLAAAPDGSLIIASYGDDWDTEVLRKVSPDGSKIERIAGTLDRSAPMGDGKPALEAHIGVVNDMAVAPDGTIYWTERPTQRSGWKGLLRKVAPDGIVTTVAGLGTKPAENGTPAAEASLGSDPQGVAIGNDGSIYIAQRYEKMVTRIDPSGRAFRFAGKGNHDERGKLGLGGQASQSYIDSPYTLAAGTDGNVYIRVLGYDVSPSSSVILRVDPNGVLQQYAGRLIGTCGSGAVDGEGATSVCLSDHSRTIGVDGDGGLTFADGRYRIRKVAPPLPGFDADGLALPSSDGSEVYEFDRNGRHLATRNGFTGAKIRTFEYDAAKQLVGVVDAGGNRTRIERDGAGKALAIVAPGGPRTTLVVNSDGWLESAKNPAGEEFRFTYANGLIKSFRKPAGGTTTFDYDGVGRLVKHNGADGEHRTLTREELEDGTRVTITTGGGKATKYTMQVLDNGDRRRIVEEPAGGKTTSTVRVDGITELVQPDGTKTEYEIAPDPRWGAQVPIVAVKTVTTPDGKTSVVKRTDRVSLATPRDPFSLTSLRTSFAETGGGTRTWEYSDETVTETSAGGRTTTTKLDVYGRVLEQSLDSDLAPLVYTYDERGRAKSMSQGAESVTFAYDAKHRLVSETDAAGHVTGYVYDDADRVIEKRLPGGRTYRYSYDDNGNIETMTSPRGKVHRFGFTDGDRSQDYTPASSTGKYARAYSNDRALQSVGLPSGATQTMGYDTGGRLTSEDHVQSKRSFTYEGGRDQFDTITRSLADGSGAQTLDVDYDGALPKRLTFGGVAAGTYEYTYGDRVLPTAEKLTVGATTVTRELGFDEDRLATKSGPFTITRQGPGGAVSKISDGKLSLEYAYDDNGRPVGRTLKVGTTERFFQQLTFNTVGLAGARSERVDGAADALSYEYDPAGQLRAVKRGGTVVESHTYDLDGNRLGGGAEYDDQDRLKARDGVSYTWDADGFLLSRGADTFTYSRSGELLAAKGVLYSYDAIGRRVARMEGAAKTTYLYGNPANPWQVTASVAGDVITTYFYDADDRLFALERAGERYYVGADANGSPRIVVRASDGVVVRKVAYDAFGVETQVTGTFELAIGFAGGLRDGVTGLVRFGLRDYDPVAGRFTAKDASFFSGSPHNLYDYAGNNPITMRDPSGLVCIGWSMYATFGGGVQLCRENKWDLDADWSVCGEAGLGLGGGADLDFAGGAADTGGTAFAELTGKAGWVGGTIGAELDLNCLNAKGSAKVMVGSVTVGADTGGGFAAGVGQNDLPMPGARLEGKVGVKVCKKW
ncbi:hypothetical protein DVA67_031915 [Solirubrobacter sp. CPCC 204708]|uniref:Uncharacterized protein n=1 Tax=Solirubrobacter deserti TaxID=2282478 RepID=A0ABT4RQV3_9ACTN|nr:RHS repeat-associated core domain-containing protein [Solirubrobacter deserti]MBE2320610.1 hypothetical protein [Solirubrobacter deserti]MDA0140665.1 hypothetical protein [Solirubrobacter deserti]